jgi:regulator of nucleoside diphosphate kinase
MNRSHTPSTTSDATIFICEEDFRRLRDLLDLVPRDTTRPDAPTLRDELDRATVAARESLPPGVVTVNSRVRFRDEESGDEEEYVITWPEHADGGVERVSVLAPIGTALIGYREGDEVSWPTPGGVRRLRVLSAEPVVVKPRAESPEDMVARILYGQR